uniref:Nucleolar protein 16 n=1 Tax=Gasterosteus aculeatus aculeatus TaxID=481459 RepID=G3NFI2_GASAC
GDFLSHGRNTTNLHPVSARCLFPYITNKPQACSVKTETIHQHAESQEVIEEKKVRLQPGPEEDEETVQQEIQPQDRKLLGPDKPTKAPTGIVTKPYVLNQLQKEANVPERDCKTLSSDLIEYAQYMIREHNDDFKAMARDEKNYYQDTPKQIKRKINEYMRCHPDDFDAFMDSLAAP